MGPVVTSCPSLFSQSHGKSGRVSSLSWCGFRLARARSGEVSKSRCFPRLQAFVNARGGFHRECVHVVTRLFFRTKKNPESRIRSIFLIPHRISLPSLCCILPCRPSIPHNFQIPARMSVNPETLADMRSDLCLPPGAELYPGLTEPMSDLAQANGRDYGMCFRRVDHKACTERRQAKPNPASFPTPSHPYRTHTAIPPYRHTQ
ncbi:hypothetical protein EGW08_017775 [Elysia chlorotica]|uniref:Uncharacterized protein n=1 Tax=Elysia chlorotica TaxID=188477 RepID=A0A433SYS9_ELYCH|nr:hypothetical protein EGW08_017775 [Elysia chlorotica]